jgi:Protein of unknown function (DUF4125)
MSDKRSVIESILDLELNMFLNVRSEVPVSCQENPEAFRLHRRAQFSTWSEETLHSYHNDLVDAEQQGRNLMTLKYARMENLIPPLNENPIIDAIVEMALEAQRGMLLRYPNILSRGRPLEDDGSGSTSFTTYLRGELETYSDRTLERLHGDIRRSAERGENWAVQTYAHLFKELGYESLDEVEERLRQKDGNV